MPIRPGHVAHRLARQFRRREVRRLKQHFARVIAELAPKDTSLLTPSQRDARSRQLKELGRYALRGSFPKNHDFLQPTPYFVDREGTRCAMAHLIESTGDHELVRHVASTRNNALVRELGDEPALHVWLDREGLTVSEAGRIQPEYCSTFAYECFCAYYSVEAVYEAVITAVTDGSATGTITAVHGTGVLQVDDVTSFYVYFSSVVEGDTVLVLSGRSDPEAVYVVRPDGTVDTRPCYSPVFGAPPASAPKNAVIANLLDGAMCGDGLASEWTDSVGSCGSSAESVGTGSGGGGSSGGGREAGVTGGAEGCGTSTTVAPFEGTVFVVSVMLAGAVRLRSRRARR